MATPASVAATVRSTRRFAEVLTVLARHGFDGFLQESGISRLIERGEQLIGLGKANPGEDHLPVAARLRLVLEDLGPTYIKLGQVLATRPDLIPPSYAAEFRKLQGDCPRVEYDVIRKRLEAEFGDRLTTLFRHIEEEPIAAASMAQVHGAELLDGTKVVLKVLRPGIERIIEADMDVLREIARFTEKHFKDLAFDPTDVVKEFSRQLERELDMVEEAKSTDRFRELFSDDPNVMFPKVYWDCSTRRVLTLERIDGQLLADVRAADMPLSEREKVVEHGANAVFRQCLEFGFFHADPHPANIFVLSGGRICFIDCGMTGRVDRRTMNQLADLVAAVVSGNVDQTIRVAINLTDADPALKSDRMFRNDTFDFISRFEGATLERLNMPALLEEFFTLSRDHGIRLPSNLVFLTKALTTIQGVGQELAPHFDIMSFARPYVEQLIRQRYGVKAAAERFERGMRNYLELAEDLPEEIRDLITQLRKRQFSVVLEHKGIDRLNDDSIEHASRNMAYAMIIAGGSVSSAILILADRVGEDLGLLGKFGVAGIAAVFIFLFLFILHRFRYRPK